MSNEQKTTQDGEATRSRRAVLKTGAILVATIATLYASPAWAATDYTRTAYRYGANVGLCRNPDFDGPSGRADRGRNPHPDGANGPWKKNDEFVPCDQLEGAGGHAIGTTTTQSDDETIIRF